MKRRIVTFSECDSPDEVQKLVQELFDNQLMLNGKIEQVEQTGVAAEAKAKKKAAAEAKALEQKGDK